MTSPSPLPFRHASFRGRIGIARTDITPPAGIYARNWGAAVHDVADSIHRPLTLTALALSSDSHASPLVLVDADLGWWKTPQTFVDFRDRLIFATSLHPSQLILALSHTHAGPPLMQADPSLPGADLLDQWMQLLFDRTVQAVQDALESREESLLDWHTGHCDLATVRDLPDPEPQNDRILCGFNPDLAADNTLIIGRVTDLSGHCRATLINYACHPTTLAWDNTAISPDYVGAMRQTMQDVTGAPALFLLGACGDLAPRYQYVGDVQVADRHGLQLGYAGLAALHNMEPAGTQLSWQETVESGAPLAAWKHQSCSPSTELGVHHSELPLPLKDWPTADELEQQRLVCTDRALEERLRRKRDIRRAIGDDRTWNLSVCAWRLGDAVLVGSCCEPYSILQQELRRRFPDQIVLCMNLINGSIGYLPPADLYDTDVYPVWQTPFDRGSLELLLEHMTQAIHDVLSR